MIAEPVRLPSVALSARPPREPHLVVVGRIQASLGIREPAYPLTGPAGYGPTSHLSEAMLFAAYRRAGEGEP